MAETSDGNSCIVPYDGKYFSLIFFAKFFLQEVFSVDETYDIGAT